MKKPKQGRQPRESRAAGSECFTYTLYENSDRQQPVCANQRNDLIDRHKKSHCIYSSQQPKHDKAGEPVGWTRHVMNLLRISTRPPGFICQAHEFILPGQVEETQYI